MHWKKYWLLLPLFLLAAILLFIYLPDHQRQYVFTIPVLFWVKSINIGSGAMKESKNATVQIRCPKSGHLFISLAHLIH